MKINTATLEIIGGDRAIQLAEEAGEPLAELSEADAIRLAALDFETRRATYEAERLVAEDDLLKRLHHSRQSWLLETKPVCDACSTETVEVLWPCEVALRLGIGDPIPLEDAG